MFRGQLQDGEEQTLSIAAGVLTVCQRGKNNSLGLPLKMTGFMMQECSRSPIQLDIGVNGKNIWALGKDSLGDFSLTGKEEYG